MVSTSDIDGDYQPTLARAKVCLDSKLVLEIDRLEEQLRTARTLDERLHRDQDAEAPALARRILELKDQAAASEVEFVFRSIGRLAYTELVRKHPATQAQAEEAGAHLSWNPDTFPPALLAAACVEPDDSTEAWWTRKYNEWGVGQVKRLWEACLTAQGGVVEVPKALAASEVISASSPSSS